jgi:hypothetical protein
MSLPVLKILMDSACALNQIWTRDYCTDYLLLSILFLKEFNQRVFIMFRERISLIRAHIGNDAGVLGAGFLALDAL